MNILILGANSDIAKAIAHAFGAQDETNLYLASRNLENLERTAKDLAIRTKSNVQTFPFDATDYDSHASFYAALPSPPDIVIACFGILGDQSKAQQSFTHAQDIIAANFLGLVSILEIVAADFSEKKQGTIVGISSVAGLRGRQSNYMYGAAKAGATAYLSGLRNRLYKHGVHVLTVLPGFVDTKMTSGMDLPKPLLARPEDLAQAVVQACKKRKNILYFKPVWRLVMGIITRIPEGIFKKLNL